ncbi:helix-turn-helix domain-containing protein [Streptomyces camelliae]|uniref:LysR family transcriptional regulator n=1 Tax=Streptomyces camelliae TaxID=3004093 RepID=A0ABY7PDP2_9ACTN|nr:LysR family transcriptional regulator [Streptomyces sp. HUAS 2-6]WBO68721.1 LysR family transcriptional regulator [Streptomyces sp. HUAS 2-6]
MTEGRPTRSPGKTDPLAVRAEPTGCSTAAQALPNLERAGVRPGDSRRCRRWSRRRAGGESRAAPGDWHGTGAAALSGFVAIAEKLHFGRAAERPHIAHPSFRQQIRLLERDLRVKLYPHTARGLQLFGAALTMHRIAGRGCR